MAVTKRQLIFSYHGQLRQVFGPLVLAMLLMSLVAFAARVLRGEAEATVRYLSNLNIAELGLFFLISLLFLYYFAKFAATVVRVRPKPHEVRARHILADEKGVYFQDMPFGEPDFYRWKEFEYARGDRLPGRMGAALTLHWEIRAARIYFSYYVPLRVAEAAAASIRFARERILRGLPNHTSGEQARPPSYIGFRIPRHAVTIHQFGRVPLLGLVLSNAFQIGFGMLLFGPLVVHLGSGLFQGRFENVILLAPLLFILARLLFHRALIDGVCSFPLGGGAVRALGSALLVQGTWVGRVDVIPGDWISEARVEDSETGGAYQVILRSNATKQVLAVSPALPEEDAQDCAEAINVWLVNCA